MFPVKGGIMEEILYINYNTKLETMISVKRIL